MRVGGASFLSFTTLNYSSRFYYNNRFVLPSRSSYTYPRSMSSINGKVRTAVDETSADGAFQRTEPGYRKSISQDKNAEYPAESGRYHLYAAAACPWAHRTMMTRALKGLEQHISFTVVHPTWQRTSTKDEHTGWVFGDPTGAPFPNADGHGGPFPATLSGLEPDPFFNAKSIRDVYDAVGDTVGKYTVPILLDKKTKTIVNNESSEIVRILNTQFNEFAENKQLDLYPENLRATIDEVNAWVYPNLNNGVYRCGFARSQEAYNEAIVQLTEAFDKVNETLQRQRYMAGDKFTEADLRLFVTLLRFDEVYVVYFKTNTRSVAHTPAILNYCREIYQMPGVKETVIMDQIKAHYYTSHPKLNYYSIIPKGPDMIKLLEQPHDRNSLFEQ